MPDCLRYIIPSSRHVIAQAILFVFRVQFTTARQQQSQNASPANHFSAAAGINAPWFEDEARQSRPEIWMRGGINAPWFEGEAREKPLRLTTLSSWRGRTPIDPANR